MAGLGPLMAWCGAYRPLSLTMHMYLHSLRSLPYVDMVNSTGEIRLSEHEKAIILITRSFGGVQVPAAITR